MGTKTNIQWTDKTWNPIRGCTRVSEGCRNCYAEAMAARFSGPGQPYEGLAERTPSGPRWTGEVAMVPDHLADPVRWNKPCRIFVNSMSDLFHESLSDTAIAAVFGVMAAAPHHIFQVLTKRPERARAWFRWLEVAALTSAEAGARFTCERDPPEAGARRLGLVLQAAQATAPRTPTTCEVHPQLRRASEVLARPWPLPNVHLGVSVENQATADARIPVLLQTPAAVRWVSYEPALGPVDFLRVSWPDLWPVDVLRGGRWEDDKRSFFHGFIQHSDMAKIGWVVVGGESGPDARPCDVEWIRSTVAACREALVPCFVKQDSGPKPGTQGRIPDDMWSVKEWPK
jgi:protein gp37